MFNFYEITNLFLKVAKKSPNKIHHPDKRCKMEFFPLYCLWTFFFGLFNFFLNILQFFDRFEIDIKFGVFCTPIHKKLDFITTF